MDIIESIANGFIIGYVLVIFKKMSDRNTKK